MPAASEFLYTILRLVPSVERGERINVGVVVFCRQLDYLGAMCDVDAARLAVLRPALDAGEVMTHLRALCDVAEGDPRGGPMASLPATQRFGWLSSPASTVIQPSPVHTGLTQDPQATLKHLFQTLVEDPA